MAHSEQLLLKTLFHSKNRSVRKVRDGEENVQEGYIGVQEGYIAVQEGYMGKKSRVIIVVHLRRCQLIA